MPTPVVVGWEDFFLLCNYARNRVSPVVPVYRCNEHKAKVLTERDACHKARHKVYDMSAIWRNDSIKRSKIRVDLTAVLATLPEITSKTNLQNNENWTNKRFIL